MKYELTLEQLYEIAQCIAHNELNAEDACDYVRDVAAEMNDIEEVL
jgi:hypothetical protein